MTSKWMKLNTKDVLPAGLPQTVYQTVSVVVGSFLPHRNEEAQWAKCHVFVFNFVQLFICRLTLSFKVNIDIIVDLKISFCAIFRYVGAHQTQHTHSPVYIHSLYACTVYIVQQARKLQVSVFHTVIA